MQRKNKLMLFGLLLSLLTSCASVPDVPVCTELGSTRGYCINTVSDKEFEINDKKPYSFDGKSKPMTWWEMRPTMVYLPASSWATIKAWVIKQCKSTGKCDKVVSSWERKVNHLDQKVNEKR